MPFQEADAGAGIPREHAHSKGAAGERGELTMRQFRHVVRSKEVKRIKTKEELLQAYAHIPVSPASANLIA